MSHFGHLNGISPAQCFPTYVRAVTSLLTTPPFSYSKRSGLSHGSTHTLVTLPAGHHFGDKVPDPIFPAITLLLFFSNSKRLVYFLVGRANKKRNRQRYNNMANRTPNLVRFYCSDRLISSYFVEYSFNGKRGPAYK